MLILGTSSLRAPPSIFLYSNSEEQRSGAWKEGATDFLTPCPWPWGDEVRVWRDSKRAVWKLVYNPPHFFSGRYVAFISYRQSPDPKPHSRGLSEIENPAQGRKEPSTPTHRPLGPADSPNQPRAFPVAAPDGLLKRRLASLLRRISIQKENPITSKISPYDVTREKWWRKPNPTSCHARVRVETPAMM